MTTTSGTPQVRTQNLTMPCDPLYPRSGLPQGVPCRVEALSNDVPANCFCLAAMSAIFTPGNNMRTLCNVE